MNNENENEYEQILTSALQKLAEEEKLSLISYLEKLISEQASQ